MASRAAIFGPMPPPAIFIEREEWEHGFAAIYTRAIAPHLVRLEARRLLMLSAVVVLAGIAAGLILCPFLMAYSGDAPSRAVAKLIVTLALLIATLAFWLSVSFSRRDERVLLPAICEQFAPLSVQIAPPGNAISLDPYWRLNVIPPHAADIRVVIKLGELFTGTRHGLVLSIAEVEVFERRMLGIGAGWMRSYDDFQAKRKGLFRGTAVAITLPEPSAEDAYAPSRFRLDSGTQRFRPLPDPRVELGIAPPEPPGGIELCTAAVERAVAAMSRVYQAPVCGAVAGNVLYVAAERQLGVLAPFATGSLWISVYRCEPAIRRALAEIAAVTQLTEAISIACKELAGR